MKKIIAGIGLMFCGILMTALILIVNSPFAMALTEWETVSGRLWYAVDSNKLIFLAVIGLAVAGIGLVLTLIGAFSKEHK